EVELPNEFLGSNSGSATFPGMSAEKLIRKIYVTAVIHFSEKQPHAPGVEVTAHRYVARLVGED
ncbi:MAG: hypothetical protein VX624_15930, partial [Pseudomonadota bacterium]|nr:hypothetical protein [Pseudomonadota bacterium]